MSLRQFPAIFATMLLLGACFTYAVNSMLGGTVKTAPARVAGQSEHSSQVSEPEVAGGHQTSAYPQEAGMPHVWRSTETRKHRRSHKDRHRKVRRRAASGSSKPPIRTAAVINPHPSAATPSTTPNPGPARSTPAAAPRPAPKPKPAPRPKQGGGGSFYTSG